jgi:hypothetical protein
VERRACTGAGRKKESGSISITQQKLVLIVEWIQKEITAIYDVPVPREEPKPVSTSKKVRILQAAHEDYEWYPTTDEILAAFSDDLYSQAKTLSSMLDNEGIYHNKRHYDGETRLSWICVLCESEFRGWLRPGFPYWCGSSTGRETK